MPMTNTEPQSEQAWRLLHGETLVGEVYVTDADFPWLSGRFVPQEEFENIRALFEEELALIDREGELDVQKWESIFSSVSWSARSASPPGSQAIASCWLP